VGMAPSACGGSALEDTLDPPYKSGATDHQGGFAVRNADVQSRLMGA
jgi:hypothetical protein